MTALFLGIVLLCLPRGIYAQSTSVVKEDRILIILDGCATMQQPSRHGVGCYEAATIFLSKLGTDMDESNRQVSFGLRVYGHQYDAARHICNDTRMEVPFSKDNHAQIYLRLKDIQPKGRGSLKYAIEQAVGQDITDTAAYRYSILVVNGGNSNNCTGDACAVLKELKDKYHSYKLYMTSLTTGQSSNDTRCYDRIFQLKNDSIMAAAVAAIISDFPKNKQAETAQPIIYQVKTKCETTRQQKQETAPAPIGNKNNKDLIAKAGTEGTVIRKQSNITTDSLQYGYLNLLNATLPGTINIKRVANGNLYQIKNVGNNFKPGKRIQLPTGTYQLTYSNTSGAAFINFTIKSNMITDVRLK